jgi:hypothetical protein
MQAHHLVASSGSTYVRRVCPVARRIFQPGERIVVCPVCDTAYTAESWNYLEGRCPVCGFREEPIPPIVEVPIREEAPSPPTEVLARSLSPGGWLYLIEGYEGKKGHRLRERGDTRIGRGPQNDVVLDSDFVSWEHALVRGDRGIFTVHDLASQNGTWLNGHQVQRSILYDGDVLTFGDRISLVFKQVRREGDRKDLVR